MDFLEKLNYLMDKKKLNKSSLSKACDIPYTTIDGWYKKGYEGLKLTTLKKLAKFFGTSLDFWASDQPFDSIDADDEVKQLVKQYSMLNDKDRNLIKSMVNSLSEKSINLEIKDKKVNKDNQKTIVNDISENTELIELTEEQHKKAREEAKKLLEGSKPIVSIAAFGGDGVESTVLTEEQHKKAREEAKKLLERE